MLKKNEAAPLDIPTLIAISVVAWITFNELHTLFGHGGACVLLGDGLQAFTTTHATCVNAALPFWSAKFYFGFPHTLNLLAVVVCVVLLRFAPTTSTSLRYYLWLSMCGNIFNAGNALLVTAVFPGGDWADFAVGLEPAVLWQGGLTLLGAVLIVTGFWLAVQFWEPLVGGNPSERPRRISGLTWISCLTAFIISVLAGLLSPLVFQWGLLQAILAPISVFWALLLPFWRWGLPSNQKSAATPLVRSVPWLITATVVFILYLIQALGIGSFPAAFLR